jgi:tetratricopeptide (TPR) repeat protein
VNRNALKFFVCGIIAVLTVTGCFQWQSDFSPHVSSLPRSNAQTLLEDADGIAGRADDKGTLMQAIEAYKQVLRADPHNFEALCYLATYHLLLGDGYSTGKANKIRNFKAALGYSERAMYTNPAFKKLVDQGTPVWQAVNSLSIQEMEAMLFWTTAVFYYYKEGLGVLGQILNYAWIKRARNVLEHMTDLDPDWNGGSIHFLWGVYYLSIPVSVGGDRELSAEYFQKAIETGPDWLLNRWGRAKYFHVKMDNPLQFKQDLQWVLAQDLQKTSGPYPWNAYFIKDARTMLDHYEAYFQPQRFRE